MVSTYLPCLLVYTHIFSKGAPCDYRGHFLPPGAPPVLLPPKPNDDWTPFTSREGFELANILYLRAHLSHSIIDDLLDIWSATLVPHDDLPPITSHQDLHAQIDAIKLGNVPWKLYTAQYQWLRPNDGPIPEWMGTKYQIWYCDPIEIVHHLLANPEFISGVDYAPHKDFQGEEWRYHDFMSGDWAWEQCVSQRLHLLTRSHLFTYRILLRWTLQPMAPCSFPSSLVATKQLSWSLLVSMFFTLFTSQLGMSTTVFNECLRQLLCSLASFQFPKVIHY